LAGLLSCREETGVARSNYLFTSESVSEGHPDKVSDRISDEVVDLYYRATIEQGLDVWALRCAAETLVTTNRVVIAGEFRGTDTVTEDLIAHHTRMAIKDIGYDQDGFSWRNADIEVLLHGQSEHIAQGVDASGNKEEGAGDQGIMFGYATNETPELMPAPIQYSHRILKLLADARHSGKEKTLAPDAKSQVTVRYENGRPKEAVSIVLSTQHTDPKQTSADIRKIVEPYIRRALGDALPIAKDCVWHINPTGKFVIGGPDGDCGLTGRKIIVDTYGGAAPHGGGAFSGKDPTKVDRSAAYAARYLAKNVVAAGLADRCVIQLSYAIGVPEPLSIYANCDGTEKCDLAKLEKRLGEVMDLRPRGIRTHLDLNKPIYARTSAYGHFGREPDADGGFSWEKTDLVGALKDLA
jgi:S-adenosylmethionine synthetase